MAVPRGLRWLINPQPAQQRALTAAVTSWTVGQDRIVPQVAPWQRECWGYYDDLGEFSFGVQWLSSMISRLRLVAAEQQPGGDEPTPLTSGPAADLITALAGGIGGQAQLMESLATQLSIPGECYIIGEDRPGGDRTWQVRSAEELRRGGQSRGVPATDMISPNGSSATRQAGVQVIDENSTPDNIVWRQVVDSSLIIRAWRPHKRLRYLADSPARHARSIMRELELVNRKIQAEYLSRLASAGVIVFPDEVQFPVRPEFQEAEDPFVKEWVQIAATAIQTPGTAASVVPLPIRVPAEYVDKIRHIDFTLKIDEKILEKRESAIRRLATTLDLPAEVLLGMGDVNHWTAWQLDEDAIKVHISPLAELICHTWTQGFLWPALKAQKVKDPERFIVWYDPSEISVRPDRSQDAVLAYDRFELSGEALRRETGFAEADAPSDDELKVQILKAVAKNPNGFMDALIELDLIPRPPAPVAPTAEAPTASGAGGAPPTPNRPDEAVPPTTRNAEPPAPGGQAQRQSAVGLTWKCRSCRREWPTSELDLVGGNGHGWFPRDGCPTCGVRLAPELVVTGGD